MAQVYVAPAALVLLVLAVLVARVHVVLVARAHVVLVARVHVPLAVLVDRVHVDLVGLAPMALAVLLLHVSQVVAAALADPAAQSESVPADHVALAAVIVGLVALAAVNSGLVVLAEVNAGPVVPAEVVVDPVAHLPQCQHALLNPACRSQHVHNRVLHNRLAGPVGYHRVPAGHRDLVDRVGPADLPAVDHVVLAVQALVDRAIHAVLLARVAQKWDAVPAARHVCRCRPCAHLVIAQMAL